MIWGRIFKWGGFILAAVIIALVALTVYRYPFAMQEKKSEAAVAFIQSRHITMDDVDGKHLPPPPDPAQVDATVEGIDANQNDIRDDVELAIFKKYPNDAKLRAAELQYAMAEQMFLTQVFDSDTWRAVANQDSRGYACISSFISRNDLDKHSQGVDSLTNVITDLEFNTPERKRAKDEANNFITSFGLPDSGFCDISSGSLQN